MKVVLVGLNCSHSHCSLACSYLQAACRAWLPQLETPARFDFLVREAPVEIAQRLADAEPDVVGFSCYIFNIRAVLAVTRALRRLRRSVFVVYGGPEMADGGAEWLRRAGGPDCVVRGEGERAFCRLLSHLGSRAPVDLAGVPSLSWLARGVFHQSACAPPIEPLDDVPSPFQTGLFEARRPFVQMETSRGCPFRCAFCLSGGPSAVRCFTLPRVYRDITCAVEHGVKAIRFADRTFNADPARAVALLQFLERRHPSLRVHLELAPWLLRRDALSAQLDRPEIHVEIGLQTLNPKVLRRVRRKAAGRRGLAMLDSLCRHSAARVHLDLIAGLPGASLADLYLDTRRVCARRPDELQIELLKVLPGSALRAKAHADRLLFDGTPPYTVRSTPTMSARDLREAALLSRLVDWFYNDAQLGPLVCWASERWPGDGAFWRAFCGWWRSRKLAAFGLGKTTRFDMLYDFLRSTPCLDGEIRARFLERWTFARLHFAKLSRRAKRGVGRFVDAGKLPRSRRRLAGYMPESACPAAGPGHWCVWSFRYDPCARAFGPPAEYAYVWVRADARSASRVTYFQRVELFSVHPRPNSV